MVQGEGNSKKKKEEGLAISGHAGANAPDGEAIGLIVVVVRVDVRAVEVQVVGVGGIGWVLRSRPVIPVRALIGAAIVA